MDVPELLRAMADVIGDVPGIGSASYPAPNTIDEADLPAVVLYWGGPDETLIDHSNATGGTLWQPSVMAQLLTARVGDTPQEFAVIDALITPIVDAFAVPVNSIPALAGKVHRCRVSRIRSSLQIGYGQSQFYAAEFSFDIKFHRRTP